MGDIVDVAVISDAVAVIGADRSVTIFEVPERWEFDDPPCRIVAHIAPSPEADIGEVNRVEWLRKEDTHHLIIGGSAGVIVVKLTTIADERGLTVANLESRLKVLKTEGVGQASTVLTAATCKLLLKLFSTSHWSAFDQRPLYPLQRVQPEPCLEPATPVYRLSSLLGALCGSEYPRRPGQ